ncbi:hypothetical protein CNMCM6106_006240 [Aspergillus hiratsukae]|uniref:GPI inositol-deacylase winged helix domain-containing protein n=1 Tax=Aspergillus hiratsukae TaxID=1194566 RepID=A0A8H6QDP3_9EURO|nr:hypothetical protein CNMCM6106_006240 [Aspergillus hiratsukae]
MSRTKTGELTGEFAQTVSPKAIIRSEQRGEAIRASSKVFVLVDALDEYQPSDRSLDKFLGEIFSLQNSTPVSFFATSRHNPGLAVTFEGCLRQDIRAKGSFWRISTLGHWWLPSGSEAIEATYREAMQRIQGPMPEQRELAMQVLAWVTCSQRPLAATELQHALAIEIGESGFDEDNVPDVEDMLSVCVGLVTLDEQTYTVRLVHYTTQEFLERTWHQWFPNAHRDIASTCITYLSYDVFDSGACTSDEDLSDRLNTYPLYRYSSVNWGDHARHQCVDTTLALKLLMNRNKVTACSQVLCLDERTARVTGWSQRSPMDVSGVHLVAHFGLEEILRKLLELSVPCDEEDSRGKTPLFWAAANRQEALARRLIEAGVEIQFEELFFSPVAVAASNGHEAVVQVLLQAGVDPDIEDIDGRTALSRAAENGHDAVVKLLLGYLASIDREDCNNRTALLWAARHGHDITVRILLEAGAEPASSDHEYGWTALSWACFNGHLEVTRLLLEAGANPDYQDINGWTPLSFAVENERVEVVQLLLDRGADMDMIHNDGLFALAVAAENGSQTMVTMLLEKGAHKRQSKEGHLIRLLNAVYRGKSHYTKLLLHEAKVAGMLSPADTHAALTLAVWKRHASIAKLLLEYGTEVDYRRSAFVQYPSSTLVRKGSMRRIVQFFKDGEPGLQVEDTSGQTVLTCAARLGHEQLVKMLLDAGANPCARDIDGRTPLIYAAAYGHVSVSRVLVKAGIDITIPDKFGRTALLSAIGGGNLAIVQMLLDTKANPSRQDRYGRDAFYEAKRRGHIDIVRALKQYAGSAGSVGEEVSSAPIADVDDAFHCSICLAGDFDICRYCRECGACCLVEEHQLTKEAANLELQCNRVHN